VEELKPLIVIVPEPDWYKRAVIDPGVDVTVYVSIVAPPLLAGALKDIEALVADSAVTDSIVGAPGAVAGGAGFSTVSENCLDVDPFQFIPEMV